MPIIGFMSVAVVLFSLSNESQNRIRGGTTTLVHSVDLLCLGLCLERGASRLG
jgi:hypothetical protein